jgi:hypothetical protein
MKRVLVFPCGSEVGLELHRALADSLHFTAIGASSVDDHGKYVYRAYVGGLPDVDAPDFLAALNAVIEAQAIDFVLPAHDSVVLKLAQHQDELRAQVVTSPADTCAICRSKGETYRVFAGRVPTPRVFATGDPIQFPIFLKPDIGQGSKGTWKARTPEDVAFHTRNDPTLLCLEYLPGKEYTVDCFTDRHGVLLFAGARERRRIQGGISVNSVEAHDPRFAGLANIINQTLIFRGAWFFQVKERGNGELVLMEIAPRIAGTMALFRADGVNLPQLSLFDRMGMDVTVLRNNLPVEIDRALTSRFSLNHVYSTVYVDLDDTLVLRGCVHTTLIRFLYQARNERKRIVLLSRHRQDVHETLRGAAISEQLFDEIRIIGENAQKGDFIAGPDAIFIDDSFAERKQVATQAHIPVFSLDAVESLLA